MTKKVISCLAMSTCEHRKGSHMVPLSWCFNVKAKAARFGVSCFILLHCVNLSKKKTGASMTCMSPSVLEDFGVQSR